MHAKSLMIAALIAALAGAATLTATSVLADGGERRQHRAEKIRQKMEERLKAADTNSDGTISKAEFLKQAEVRFKKIDANNDGGLTKAEFEAMHEKFRKERHDRKNDEKSDEQPETP